MFNFRKKEQSTKFENEILKRVSLFYEMYNNIFINFSNATEKREIIKNLYKILKYDQLPTLYSTSNEQNIDSLKIYRGISANDIETLKTYINDFIKGNVFYGGRASIYGTGIYTIIDSNSDVAQKYASDGGTNNCGIVIESTIQPDTKIIKSAEIEPIRNIIFDKLKKIYKSGTENFLAVLEDDGALASILGYDAILVSEKNYLVILNRAKMIVNDININEQINYIDNKHPKL